MRWPDAEKRTVRTTVTLDDGLLQEATVAAARSGRTLSDLVADGLRQLLAQSTSGASAPVRPGRPLTAGPGHDRRGRRGTVDVMVLEIAQIDVTPGSEDAFADAYSRAAGLVAQTEGCRSMRMTRGIESPSRFVLLVEWDSVEAHEGFRSSDRFGSWRELIGPHFAGPPQVEHYRDL